MIGSLKSMGIPHCVIKEGDDLGATLSNTIARPNWS